MSVKEPEFVKVKARDVRPFHYAVWCTFEGSPDKPVSNDIELVQWSPDGTKVRMLLASHNTLSEDPDTVLELIPLKPDAYYAKKYGPGVWTLGPPPKQPEDPREDELVRLRRQLRDSNKLLRWYVENDDTNEGGKWEESNASWLEKKRAAMRLLGMSPVMDEVSPFDEKDWQPTKTDATAALFNPPTKTEK